MYLSCPLYLYPEICKRIPMGGASYKFAKEHPFMCLTTKKASIRFDNNNFISGGPALTVIVVKLTLKQPGKPCI